MVIYLAASVNFSSWGGLSSNSVSKGVLIFRYQKNSKRVFGICHMYTFVVKTLWYSWAMASTRQKSQWGRTGLNEFFCASLCAEWGEYCPVNNQISVTLKTSMRNSQTTAVTISVQERTLSAYNWLSFASISHLLMMFY